MRSAAGGDPNGSGHVPIGTVANPDKGFCSILAGDHEPGHAWGRTKSAEDLSMGSAMSPDLDERDAASRTGTPSILSLQGDLARVRLVSGLILARES